MIEALIPRTSKIGRNDKCECGTGKKYKKCCLRKQQKIVKASHRTVKNMWDIARTFPDEQEQIEAMIAREDIEPDEFNTADDVKWIKRNENIPSEIKPQIDEFIETYPMKEQLCWYNAQAVTEKVIGVEKVDGWYGHLETERFEKVIDRFDYDVEKDDFSTSGKIKMKVYGKKFEKLGNGIWNLTEKDKDENSQITVWDFQTHILWYRHSWNAYKGAHFDLTKNLNPEFSNEWINYKEHPMRQAITKETVMKNINTSHKNLPVNEITQSILDLNLLMEHKGFDTYKVLNESYVGKSLMLGGA
jgi:uncharacterized protein (UPF0333 family)